MQATPARPRGARRRLPRRRGAAHRPRRAHSASTPTHKRGLVWVTSAEDVPDDLADRDALPHERLRQGRHLLQRRPRARARATSTRRSRVTPTSSTRSSARWRARPTLYRDTGGMHACGLARDGELAARARGRRPAQRGRQAARPRVARPHPDRRRGAALDRAHQLRDGGQGREGARAVVVSRSAVTDLAAEIGDRARHHARGLRARRQADRLHAPRADLDAAEEADDDRDDDRRGGARARLRARRASAAPRTCRIARRARPRARRGRRERHRRRAVRQLGDGRLRRARRRPRRRDGRRRPSCSTSSRTSPPATTAGGDGRARAGRAHHDRRAGARRAPTRS